MQAAFEIVRLSFANSVTVRVFKKVGNGMLPKAPAEIKVANQRFPRKINAAKYMRTLCEAKELTLQVSFSCEHNENVVGYQFQIPKSSSRTNWLRFPAPILRIGISEVTHQTLHNITDTSG